MGVGRLQNGALHVAWIRRTGGNQYDLLDTPIARSGAIGAPRVIVTGWHQLNQVALYATRATASTVPTLTAYFEGAQTAVTGEPYAGIMRAVSSDDGATWSLPEPGAVFPVSGASAGLSAVPLTGDTAGALVTWPDLTAGPVVAFGPGVRQDNHTLVPYGPTVCCTEGYNVAAYGDEYATSAAWLAWCAQNDAPRGRWVQKLDIRIDGRNAPPEPYPDADGAPHVLPGTDGLLCEATGRVPLVQAGVAEPAHQPRFFVADTAGADGTEVRLWSLGTKRKPVVVARGHGEFKDRVALAADPEGRLWVAWRTFHDASTLHLRRSNRAGTIFGAQVDVKAPVGAVEIARTDLSAQADRVDALVSFSFVGGVRGNPYHRQINPGLTLVATGGATVRFAVTDAGDPVANATVKVAGTTLHTDAGGRAAADLRRGRFAAPASKPGYVPATVTVRST